MAQEVTPEISSRKMEVERGWWREKARKVRSFFDRIFMPYSFLELAVPAPTFLIYITSPEIFCPALGRKAPKDFRAPDIFSAWKGSSSAVPSPGVKIISLV